MILIESHPGDDHLAGVRTELERRGHQVVVFDTGRYPVDTALSIAYGDQPTPDLHLRVDGITHDLSTCTAAWWRRPQPFTLHAGLTDPDARTFAWNEASEGIEGLRALLKVSWINDPTRDVRAAHKAYQLREARRSGLVTPRTLMTNDPAAARAFVAELAPSRVVYKSFLAHEGAWRETRVLKADELDRMDLVQVAPVIFQEYVPGYTDLRVTVVGDVIHAAQIYSASTAYPTDYRMALATVPMEPYVLPGPLHRKVLTFMRRLGLVYGALDFRIRPDGEHVFFEINPSGQWLFIEERTGLPITNTFVDALSAADQGAPHPRSAPSGCPDCEQNVPRGPTGRGARDSTAGSRLGLTR